MYCSPHASNSEPNISCIICSPSLLYYPMIASSPASINLTAPSASPQAPGSLLHPSCLSRCGGCCSWSSKSSFGLWGSSFSSSPAPGNKDLLQFSAVHQLLSCYPPHTYPYGFSVHHVLSLLDSIICTLRLPSACVSSLITMLMDYYSLTPREKIGELISSATSLAVVKTWIISTFCILFSSKTWSKMYVVLRKQLILISLWTTSYPTKFWGTRNCTENASQLRRCCYSITHCTKHSVLAKHEKGAVISSVSGNS